MTHNAPTTEKVGAHNRTPLREWGWVIVLALIPALPLLVGSGLVNTRAGGDSPFLLVRVQQLALSLRAGVFPVRWMPQAAYGLGYPFFNFYAALPYYLAALLKLAGLGYLWAIKLTQALGFVFAGLAMYGLSKELGHNRAASLLVTLVYSCTPFHLINVYVRGDSLSEFYAFVFYPLLLWSLLRLGKEARLQENGFLRLRGAFLGVALSFAGLMLTHNLSAFIFTPFVLLYVLVLGVHAFASASRHLFDETARQWVRQLVTSAIALAAGALLSAWFWLPALAERGNVVLKDMTTGYFNYALHFRGMDLLQRAIVFDYAITADKNPFRMGLVQAVLALAGLIAILVWWIRSRRVEINSAFWVFLAVSSTFMITPLSRPLWAHLPLLPMVQFPWRFLSIQAVAASLLVAYLVPRQPRQGWIVVLLLGLLVGVAALAGLNPERLLIHEDDITAQRLAEYEYFTANVGTTIRHDWLPRWVDPRPYTSEVVWQGEAKPAPLAVEGQIAQASLLALYPTAERWMIEVASPQALLAFHTYYYPGWEARLDGQPATVEVLPGLGYLGLRIGQGRHEVELRLERTRTRLVAETISALAAIVLVVLLVWRLRFNRRTLFVPVTVLVTGTLFMVAALVAAPSATAPPAVVTELPAGKLDLTMDFDRSPYLHHNPDGIHFADACRFTGYTLSSAALRAGETLTVTTYWDKVHAYQLLDRVTLVSPAQHLFGVPQAIASSERLLTADHHAHALTIPESTAPGLYLVTVRVYSPDGEIQPQDSRGQTLGTTYLLPVRVTGMIQARGDEPVLERFGECITLSQAQTSQSVAGSLDVTLTWQVLAQPAQNYKVALRLRDPSGWEVGRLDTQPGYGFYPTSMWRAGELVHDRYALPLDDGAPPGTQYSLDVTLYESASLRPIGTTRVPNIAIQQATVRPTDTALYRFGPAIALLDAKMPQVEVEGGAELALLLKWTTRAQVDGDYMCRIALRDGAGKTVHEQSMPLGNGYPTSLWPRDAIVAGRYALRLSPDFASGEYTVAMTVVEPSSGAETGPFVLPTALRVTAPARNFAIPQMQQPVGADFGGQVRLLGYDLQRTEKELALTLHWQALVAMDADYKLFVHLFDPQTEQIVSQQDILVGGDGHPTTRWVPQEVVSSQISLPLAGVPPGQYRLAVGLYQPSGRLPVTAPAGFTVSADRLLLSETIGAPGPSVLTPQG
jgi:hypothetical protein